MSSEEEVDYMSEDFIKSCVKQDVRPGLAFSHSLKRKLNVDKKKQISQEQHKNLHRPVKILEAERREEGLSAPISSSSRGFSMLMKMGFKPGSGLGKAAEGRTEPIAVELKSDRSGLGREAAMKELADKKAAMRLKKLTKSDKVMSVEEFRAHKKNQANQRQIVRDISICQKACYNLDSSKALIEPAEPWFWPPKPKVELDEHEEQESRRKQQKIAGPDDSEDEEVEGDDLEPIEKLELLVSYLRMAHLYCAWCGVSYESEEDMKKSCPGPEKDDH